MNVTLDNIWLNKLETHDEIRMDWSNDRHHALRIEKTDDRFDIAERLTDLAYKICNDPHFGDDEE